MGANPLPLCFPGNPSTIKCRTLGAGVFRRPAKPSTYAFNQCPSCRSASVAPCYPSPGRGSNYFYGYDNVKTNPIPYGYYSSNGNTAPSIPYCYQQQCYYYQQYPSEKSVGPTANSTTSCRSAIEDDYNNERKQPIFNHCNFYCTEPPPGPPDLNCCESAAACTNDIEANGTNPSTFPTTLYANNNCLSPSENKALPPNGTPEPALSSESHLPPSKGLNQNKYENTEGRIMKNNFTEPDYSLIKQANYELTKAVQYSPSQVNQGTGTDVPDFKNSAVGTETLLLTPPKLPPTAPFPAVGHGLISYPGNLGSQDISKEDHSPRDSYGSSMDEQPTSNDTSANRADYINAWSKVKPHLDTRFIDTSVRGERHQDGTLANTNRDRGEEDPLTVQKNREYTQHTTPTPSLREGTKLYPRYCPGEYHREEQNPLVDERFIWRQITGCPQNSCPLPPNVYAGGRFDPRLEYNKWEVTSNNKQSRRKEKDNNNGGAIPCSPFDPFSPGLDPTQFNIGDQGSTATADSNGRTGTQDRNEKVKIKSKGLKRKRQRMRRRKGTHVGKAVNVPKLL